MCVHGSATVPVAPSGAPPDGIAEKIGGPPQGEVNREMRKPRERIVFKDNDRPFKAKFALVDLSSQTAAIVQDGGEFVAGICGCGDGGSGGGAFVAGICDGGSGGGEFVIGICGAGNGSGAFVAGICAGGDGSDGLLIAGICGGGDGSDGLLIAGICGGGDGSGGLLIAGICGGGDGSGGLLVADICGGGDGSCCEMPQTKANAVAAPIKMRVFMLIHFPTFLLPIIKTT